MLDEIDHNPVHREAQLRAACEMMRARYSDVDLRQVCAVILALSCEPMDRTIAETVLQYLDT